MPNGNPASGNSDPIADAGDNKSVSVGSKVYLDGSKSTDIDNDNLTYEWKQISGPNVTLDGSGAIVSFIPNVEGEYEFLLTVTDDKGGTSESKVKITVKGKSSNGAPVAEAGPDRQVHEGLKIVLDGSSSSDPDGNSDIKIYKWTQLSGQHVTLEDANTAKATFTSPTGPATLIFELYVEDNSGNNDTDAVKITVLKDNSKPTQYSLTVVTQGQGSVTPATGAYDEGSQVQITANPANGWRFDSWQGDASGSNNPITITMNSDKSITAVFTEIPPNTRQYRLTSNVQGQGSITLEPDGGIYNEGTQVKITANPANGWRFDSWQGDASGSNNPITITMNSDKSITAVFEEQIVVKMWQKAIGGADSDIGKCVRQTSDGGYIIVGTTKTPGTDNHDVYLVKIDADGNKTWEKTFGTVDDDDGAMSIRQCSDGGYIIVGTSKVAATNQYLLYIIRTDVSGNVIWSKKIGGTNMAIGYDVCINPDGTFVAVGTIYKLVGGQVTDQNAYMIKINDSGKGIWISEIGTADALEIGYSVRRTSDNGYIIAGQKRAGGNSDVYLIKTDSHGHVSWANTFGGANSEEGRCAIQTSDGGYIITGKTMTYGNGVTDGYLVKTNAVGNKVWDRPFGGYGNGDAGYCVIQVSDGGYLVAGVTDSFGASKDGYLIKFSASGITVWEKTFGGDKDEYFYSLDVSDNGGYIITGQTQSYGAGDDDIYVVKTDENGNSPNAP